MINDLNVSTLSYDGSRDGNFSDWLEGQKKMQQSLNAGRYITSVVVERDGSTVISRGDSSQPEYYPSGVYGLPAAPRQEPKQVSTLHQSSPNVQATATKTSTSTPTRTIISSRIGQINNVPPELQELAKAHQQAVLSNVEYSIETPDVNTKKLKEESEELKKSINEHPELLEDENVNEMLDELQELLDCMGNTGDLIALSKKINYKFYEIKEFISVVYKYLAPLFPYTAIQQE